MSLRLISRISTLERRSAARGCGPCAVCGDAGLPSYLNHWDDSIPPGGGCPACGRVIEVVFISRPYPRPVQRAEQVARS